MTGKKNKRILEAGSIALDLNLHFSKYLYEKESSESKAIINKIGNAFNEAKDSTNLFLRSLILKNKKP